jgi:uncharacterized protein (TIGR02594 family)
MTFDEAFAAARKAGKKTFIFNGKTYSTAVAVKPKPKPRPTPPHPGWLLRANQYVGLKEVPGPKHNPTILKWLNQLGAWWREDETPWCGTFVAACMEEAGLPKAKDWFRAKAWMKWGVPVTARVGAVAVFDRQGGGHVGFVVGETAYHYAVLGGNQGNMVNVIGMPKNRLVGFRWPAGDTSPPIPLPTLLKIDPTNGNEA